MFQLLHKPEGGEIWGGTRGRGKEKWGFQGFWFPGNKLTGLETRKVQNGDRKQQVTTRKRKRLRARKAHVRARTPPPP